MHKFLWPIYSQRGSSLLQFELHRIWIKYMKYWAMLGVNVAEGRTEAGRTGRRIEETNHAIILWPKMYACEKYQPKSKEFTNAKSVLLSSHTNNTFPYNGIGIPFYLRDIAGDDSLCVSCRMFLSTIRGGHGKYITANEKITGTGISVLFSLPSSLAVEQFKVLSWYSLA